jgi:hypothetical protein
MKNIRSCHTEEDSKDVRSQLHNTLDDTKLIC